MGARWDAVRDWVGAGVADFAINHICSPAHGSIISKAIEYGMGMAVEDFVAQRSLMLVDALREARGNHAEDDDESILEVITGDRILVYATYCENGHQDLTIPELGLAMKYSGTPENLENELERIIASLTKQPRDDIKIRVIRVAGEGN